MARVGFLFTLDALIAIAVLLGAVLLVAQIDTSASDRTSQQLYAQDVISSLGAMKLGELSQHQDLTDIMNDTGLSDNDSVLYGIGMLWVLNDSRLSVLTSPLEGLTQDGSNLRLELEGDELFDTNRTTTGTTIAVARQQITGIDQGRPVAGSSSTAYLRKLRDKQTASYAYYGGFVGQGNITVTLELPADVDSSRIRSVILEADIQQDFTVSFNSIACGTYSPVAIDMAPSVFDLGACNSSLGPGMNDIEIRFDDLEDAFIAGGYLKVGFWTDEFITESALDQTKYSFPEIDGVVNLYDGMIIPEDLDSLTIRLHYRTDDPNVTTYLALGEKVVYESQQVGEVDITLDDTNLSMLDYQQLSSKTVPVRFASFNTSTTTYRGGDADVVLITDYSGSMMKSVSSDSQGNSGSVDDCEGDVYPSTTIRRTHLARCLDKEVVEVLFNETANITGNRLWPTHFRDDDLYTYINPEDPEALLSYYETFSVVWPQQGKGQTCIACALSEAYETLEDNYVENRSRYVILMSDGLPTHCTAQGCSARDTAYGAEVCQGYCDVSGQNCDGTVAYCTNNQCSDAIDNAVVVAQQLREDMNVTIFTVGLGPVESCDNATMALQRIADVGGGTFQTASDVDALKQIYQNISYSILEAIEFESQSAVVRGNVTRSTLYGDSHILAQHSLPSNPPAANEIEITRQTEQFGSCNPSIILPDTVRYKQAHVISYSGTHWTELLTVQGQTVHNLTEFLVSYTRLGDPYRLHVPVSLLADSTSLMIRTADSPTNLTGCSNNNSMIYTAYVPSATARTSVLEEADGCTWTIEMDDGATLVTAVPADYSGPNVCSYTSSDQSHDPDDAMQAAVYELLSQLDFDGDGRIFVSLAAEDLEIIVTKVSSVPYLWGPIILQAEVSR